MKSDISSVLWDVAHDVRSGLPREFVVRRVLIYGTIRLIIETIRTEGIDYVRTIFSQLKSSEIAHRRKLYLKNYLLK